jgi:hypothetical protein
MGIVNAVKKMGPPNVCAVTVEDETELPDVKRVIDITDGLSTLLI